MITRILAYFRAIVIARQRLITEQWQAANENARHRALPAAQASRRGEAGSTGVQVMKRYDPYTLDSRNPMVEDADGKWVHIDDVQAEIHRLNNALTSALLERDIYKRDLEHLS